MRVKVRINRARAAFVAPVTDAHPDYLAVARFQELKEASRGKYPNVGDSVAFLYDKEPKHGKGTLTVAYGKRYGGSNQGTNDYRHMIVTREGERHYVTSDRVAVI